MEDALSGNVAEFGGLDGMEGVFTCAKAVEHVVASCVARVDGSALIPILAIGINRIDHGRLLCSSTTSPMCIEYQVKEHDLRCDARFCAGFRTPAMTRLATRWGGRRLKSAKARNRGR